MRNGLVEGVRVAAVSSLDSLRSGEEDAWIGRVLCAVCVFGRSCVRATRCAERLLYCTELLAMPRLMICSYLATNQHKSVLICCQVSQISTCIHYLFISARQYIHGAAHLPRNFNLIELYWSAHVTVIRYII